MARGDQRLRRAHRTARAPQRRVRDQDDDGIIPVLARTAREVEAAAQRGPVRPSDRTKFQVVAVLARQERARVRAEISNDARRSGMLKRLDGIALLLAQTATRDTSLLELLAEDAVLSDAARTLTRNLLKDAGIEAAPVEATPPEPPVAPAAAERRVVPQTIVSRQLANPFLAPDFSAVRPSAAPARRLATWELLGPLFSSFERAGGGASPCMALPAPSSLHAPGGRELMPHQAQLVAAAAAGHRSFLLADEPGLGKTAQALLAAKAANAYPLLVVVPN
ncbi:MAG TPA: ATP-dependent helicase, partial [Pseudonocardia sp.]|nr:ATP-dependent helicase [Pseudonocardia sp.]